MHFAFSVSIPESAFAAVWYLLATDFAADMLLSGVGNAQEKLCTIGISPVKELILTASTPRDVLHEFCFSHPQQSGPTLGYISYTYGLALHGIASEKPQTLPQGHLKQYAVILTVDMASGTLECFAREDAAGELLQQLEALLCFPEGISTVPLKAPEKVVAGLSQSFSQKEYEKGVKQVLEHIRCGDTYQLNLSIAFMLSLPELDAAHVFTHLWEQYPAAFYAWLHSGSFRIISTSPERYLRVKDGQVLSQPIKGTLAFERYFPGLEEKVTQSPKESAELSMIVDLIRNDISTHCEYGSVIVSKHKDTFVVDNLIQMYSNVCGALRPEANCLDLLLDAFPGGSITGCPKLRTMEIIEKLEPHSRDLYCGSVVCIEDEKNMDSSIAIRTAWYGVHDALFRYYAGSGLVIDSVPCREYLETIAKAEKFAKVLVP